MSKTTITQQQLKKILHYNPDTGVFTWLKSSGGKMKGSIAGTLEQRGYASIGINKKVYSSHRLAFLYMTGNIPIEVNHKNRVRHDNKWNNLEACDRSDNMKNKTKYKNSKNKHCGVYRRKNCNRFEAQIRVKGKLISLGYFREESDAVVARKHAEKLYGFSGGHGS